MLLRKARCESRLNPKAWNGWDVNAQRGDASRGLFQFIPSTWQTTPYGRRDIWSARWQSLAAAWMHSVGRGGEWACR